MARNHPIPDRETVSVAEAAARLGVAEWSVYEKLRDGRMPVPVIRFGARILIPKLAFEKYLSGELRTGRGR